MDGDRPRGHRYRLVLRGELSDRLGTLFGAMQLERHAGTTSLTGWVVDQVQLVGLIERRPPIRIVFNCAVFGIGGGLAGLALPHIHGSGATGAGVQVAVMYAIPK